MRLLFKTIINVCMHDGHIIYTFVLHLKEQFRKLTTPLLSLFSILHHFWNRKRHFSGYKCDDTVNHLLYIFTFTFIQAHICFLVLAWLNTSFCMSTWLLMTLKHFINIVYVYRTLFILGYFRFLTLKTIPPCLEFDSPILDCVMLKYDKKLNSPSV